MVFSRSIHTATVKCDSAAVCENKNNFAIATFSIHSKKLLCIIISVYVPQKCHLASFY